MNVANLTGAPPGGPPSAATVGGWVARTYMLDHLVRLLCGPEDRFRAHVQTITGSAGSNPMRVVPEDRLEHVHASGPSELSDEELAILLFEDVTSLCQLRLLLDVADAAMPEAWVLACVVSCKLVPKKPLV